MTENTKNVDYRKDHNSLAPALIENQPINNLIQKINTVH